MRRLGAVTLLALALAGVVACGSGGGGGAGSVAGGGTGGTGAVAYGTVTRLGSIWVNGVKWETDGATIYLPDYPNGVTGDDSEGGGYLDKGMVVVVEGQRTGGDSARAKTITYRSTLTGPVSSVGSDSFEVLGQTVVFEPGLTHGADGRAPAALGELGLALGQWVEVSGLIDNRGQIRARYINQAIGEQTYRLMGYIDSVSNPSTFVIGSLTVSHGSDTSFAEGDFVEVEGASLSGQVLAANGVERLDSEAGNIGNTEEFELEGVVRAVDVDADLSSLVLSGYTVEWDGDTVFEGGSVEDIIAGVRMQVEGSLSDGKVSARVIEFGDAIELVGEVAAADGANLTLTGLPWLSIAYGSATAIDNGTGSPLTAGQKVSVRAREGAGDTLVATGIEVSSEKVQAVLVRGPLAMDYGTPTVLGIPLSDIPSYYLGVQKVTQEAFLAAVSEGDLVEVEGALQPPIQWNSVREE